ncbi:2Fe-2S ferredoxin-type domain-containing protein [Crassisporium funariophilum]|nr:2Fe-2S ferredoxin-type domain-containing protein [Crassisporium funariophilum]
MFKTHAQLNAFIRPVARCSHRPQGLTKFKTKVSLTPTRCLHAPTAVIPKLLEQPRRTAFPTRMMHSMGRKQSTHTLSPWPEWFSDRRMRSLHSSAVTRHGGLDRPAPGTGIKVHFKDSAGVLLKTVEANEGDDILSIAHEYDIDLEGACEGSVACSTCHVILPEEYYDLLPEPEDDENDMLDMAFGLTDTSRLGCQVKLTRELDGITCTLPSATRNMFVDGKKASH